MGRGGQSLPVPAFGGGNGGGEASIGRQLRRIMAIVTGGGLILALALLALQAIAKPGLRPTDLLAAFETQYLLGTIAGKTGGDPAHPTMTEPEYQRVIAEAQREGAAQAEARLQEKIIVLQTEQQRYIAAYTSLFQRANMIAQAGLEMEAQLQATKAQATVGAEGGNMTVASIGDVLCALTVQEGCAASAVAKERIRQDIDNARTSEVGSRIRELMGENPDPAQLAIGASPNMLR